MGKRSALGMLMALLVAGLLTCAGCQEDRTRKVPPLPPPGEQSAIIFQAN